MSGLFGGGGGASTEQQIYAGIQVSTSTYGGCIPWIGGRQRVTFTLQWYGNFQSHASSAQGGKGGGGGGKSYTYSTAFIAGLCLGPIAGVTTVWHDKSIVTLTDENLALSLGGSAPAIWTGYPAGTPTVQQIPYDRQAYVASDNYNLGSSASMPNLAFEVEGSVGSFSAANSIFDADPSASIQDYLLNTVYGALAGYPVSFTIGSADFPLTGASNSYQAYCMAMGLLTSPFEDTQRQATDFLKELLDCTNSTCRLSCGVFEILPYADTPVSATVAGTTYSYTPNLTPVFAFTDDDFCPESDEDPPVQIKRTALTDTYNSVNVEFLDRSNQYNAAPVNCSDQGDISLNGTRLASTLSWHQITSSTTAKTAGQLWLQRQLYERNSYTFRVRSDYSLLEPGDIISVTDTTQGIIGQDCQITELDDDGGDSDDGYITITALELPGVTRSTAQYDWSAAAGYFANYATVPGPVADPLIFQYPPLPGIAPGVIALGIAASGDQSTAFWGGAYVYASVDGGSTYQNIGIVGPGGTPRYGTLTAALASHIDPDTASTLSILLSDDGLQLSTAVTHGDADSMRTLSLVGSGSGTEVISYGAAALTAPGAYNLTYLRRGLYGSAPGAHVLGDPFILLDGSILTIDIDAGLAGQTLHFKFTSFNIWGRAVEDLADVTDYTWTVPAINTTITDRILTVGDLKGSLSGTTPPAVFNDATWGPVIRFTQGTTSNTATQFGPNLSDLAAGTYRVTAICRVSNNSSSAVIGHFDSAFASTASANQQVVNWNDFPAANQWFHISYDMIQLPPNYTGGYQVRFFPTNLSAGPAGATFDILAYEIAPKQLGNIDQLPDGTDYAKVLSVGLSSGVLTTIGLVPNAATELMQSTPADGTFAPSGFSIPGSVASTFASATYTNPLATPITCIVEYKTDFNQSAASAISNFKVQSLTSGLGAGNYIENAALVSAISPAIQSRSGAYFVTVPGGTTVTASITVTFTISSSGSVPSFHWFNAAISIQGIKR